MRITTDIREETRSHALLYRAVIHSPFSNGMMSWLVDPAFHGKAMLKRFKRAAVLAAKRSIQTSIGTKWA